MPSEDTHALMRLHVETCVPLMVYEILRSGGIDERHLARAKEHGQAIAEHGDALLYREGTTRNKEGQINNIGTAEMVNKLVEGLAILSFCPGGVTFLGLHFDASEMAKRLGIAMAAEEYTLEPLEGLEESEVAS